MSDTKVVLTLYYWTANESNRFEKQESIGEYFDIYYYILGHKDPDWLLYFLRYSFLAFFWNS